MWLYGFELQECFATEDGIRGASLAVVLPQMHELGAKFDLQELMKEIEVSVAGAQPSIKFSGWFWPMVQNVWSSPDSSIALRQTLLVLIRTQFLTQPAVVRKVQKTILDIIEECPELTYDLLVSGGFDGEGFKSLEMRNLFNLKLTMDVRIGVRKQEPWIAHRSTVTKQIFEAFPVDIQGRYMTYRSMSSSFTLS